MVPTRVRCILLLLVFAANLGACASAPSPSAAPPNYTATLSPAIPSTTPGGCTPTPDDGVSPSYRPNTPLRETVGQGHVLTGVVRSSKDCSPIPKALVELWPEYPGRGHPDDARATVLTNDMGEYRFECELPDHIHMRISAPGFLTIGQNSYHPNGQPNGTFDIVLAPET